MENEGSYKPVGFKERIYMLLAKGLLRFTKESAEDSFQDIYAAGMTSNFNWIHGIIYPRFFEKIHIETDNLEQIEEVAKNATIIYITKDIGQLEYNFFNYLFMNEGLPLAKFVNELSLWQWLPYKQLKEIAIARAERFEKFGPLPHPVSSGYLGALIESGNSVFLQLKTTAIYNDLYWYTPKEDPLASLLSALEREQRPIYFVPLHFLWDKRPEGSDGSLINILPKRLSKIILFWKNYKNRAVVKIGAPVRLSEFISSYASQQLTDRSRSLRSNLLNLISQEKKAITGPSLKPRSWIIDELLEDDLLQKVVYDVSAEKKTSLDDVKALARKYAEEIAADINYNYIGIGSRIMQWTIKNIYDGVFLNMDGLSKLKKAATKAPVILIPNHRSHMDYLILSTILYENNVTIPHIAAGMNLSFWPMGHIFRRCGAYFIRRSFSGNILYRTIFKTYLKILLKEGYCNEFFIEGGRTRTGKLLRPRIGMLTMLSEAMKEGAAKEVIFVPVSITYDQIIEEYKSELKGETKKTEGRLDILRIGRFLRRKYGKIYVRFGEPISYTDIPAEPAETAIRLANSITVTINREMVVTPTAVTASAILISPTKGVTHESVAKNAVEIIKYLKWKGTAFSSSFDPDPEAAVLETVQKFTDSKLLELHSEFDPMCYEIKDDGRVNLNYYKNNILHFFISTSCIASALVAYMRKGNLHPTIDELKMSYIFCKRLFSHEFAFGTRTTPEEHIQKALSYFEGSLSDMSKLEMYKALLKNYFESYLIALTACKNINQIEEKALLKTMIKFGNHMLLLGHVTMTESISNPTFKNAITSFTAQGLLKVEGDSKGKKIYTWTGNESLAENLKLTLEELC